MWLRLAAMAALSVVLCESALAQTRNVLTLDDAFARVADSHPDLRLIGSRQDVLSAERDRAAQGPALVAGASVENAFGTGEARALEQAELSLTLASVLERGGKLDARRTLAQSRIDALPEELRPLDRAEGYRVQAFIEDRTKKNP